MSISGRILAKDIELSAGFTGESMKTLADAIGKSFVDHLKTGIVSTTDVGTVPGPGKGTGTILGLLPPVFQSQLINNLSEFTGTSLLPLVTAIANATVKHISSMAIVNTTHAPVFVGTGTGQISGLNDSALSSMIRSAVDFDGGPDWPYLCDGLAKSFVGFVQTNGIASVVIVGSPTGATSPGGGSGVGNIT